MIVLLSLLLVFMTVMSASRFKELFVLGSYSIIYFVSMLALWNVDGWLYYFLTCCITSLCYSYYDIMCKRYKYSRQIQIICLIETITYGMGYIAYLLNYNDRIFIITSLSALMLMYVAYLFCIEIVKNYVRFESVDRVLRIIKSNN